MLDIISVFLLGLGVIVHPCTIAPNIATMAFLKKGKSSGRDVLWMYVLGHSLLYALLGIGVALLLRMGIMGNGLEDVLKTWGQPVLVSLFFLSGVLLVVSAVRNHVHHHHIRILSNKRGAFVSGVLMALAFCPEAAIAFFGVLIPLTLTSSAGLLLPVVFAFSTALPLIGLEWLMHRGTMEGLPYTKKMARWMNLAIGIMFIVTSLIIYFL